MEKSLIKQHVDTKLKLKDLEHQLQAEFYRQYEASFRLVSDILYRVKEDKNGFNRTKFVLPKQISERGDYKNTQPNLWSSFGKKKNLQ